jgi:flagellar biosynthesis protein FlhG
LDRPHHEPNRLRVEADKPMEPQPQVGDSIASRLMQRWLPRPKSPSQSCVEAQVVAVASGKGGTGKSFLVSNLAVALHRLGRRTVVVDCDFGLGNAHLLFGVNPQRSMHHLLSGLASPADVLTSTEHGPGLIAGGSGISSLADLDEGHFIHFARALGELARQHDVILLDCAAGLSPQSVLTLLSADHLVVVTNPEIAALTDAYALIKCVARQRITPQMHVVVNRVPSPGLGEPTFCRLAEVTERFVGHALHFLGEVPETPDVSHRRLGQPPLLVSHPEGQAACSIRSILEEMENRTGGLVSRSRDGVGVESRLLDLLRSK